MSVPDAAHAKPPRPMPTTGMRGGLGRTLLTAFLVLATVPLSLVSFLAYDRVRDDQQNLARERLDIIVDLICTEFQNWAAGGETKLVAMSNDMTIKQNIARLMMGGPEQAEMQNRWLDDNTSLTSLYGHTFESIWLMDNQAQRAISLWSPYTSSITLTPSISACMPSSNQASPSLQRCLITADDGTAQLSLITPINIVPNTQMSVPPPARSPAPKTDLYLLGLSKLPQQLSTLWSSKSDSTHREHIYFLGQDGRLFTLNGRPLPSSALSPVTNTHQDGDNLYINHEGVPVFGAYCWLPGLKYAVLAEQNQSNAFAASDRFAVSLIAAALTAALLTTIIAALVTRQLTRPIVRLTEAALLMAQGDLSQRVQTERRDEIGILARVFNKMAADLGELYTGLEQKVAERTHELEDAKEQIQYHAWQLSISAEVGRITTSILDLDMLLERSAHLIRDAFQLDHVGIYLLDSAGAVAILWKNAGRAVPPYERQIHISGNHPVSRAIAGRMVRTIVQPASHDTLTDCHKLALPLAVGTKVIGALDLTNYDPAGFMETDQNVLQSLADQLSVAIQNARAYGYERRVIDEMREVDRLRGQFLIRVSHELATCLNNIIGFSQVMLKGVEGPLTDLQRQDLFAIHHSGQQLSRLLSDIHDLANLEVGAIELNKAPVDVANLIESTQTIMSPGLNNVQLHIDIQTEPAIPIILADADRLRQVLTNLISAAAGLSSGETVTVQARQIGGDVHFVINAPMINENNPSNDDISLAVSRRLIELHGGRLRVAEHASGEIVFAFHLPINPKRVIETSNLRQYMRNMTENMPARGRYEHK